MEPPERLFAPLARLLRENGVAAELNFHSNNTPPEGFIRLCIEQGVKLTFGSDAHFMYEIGEFASHIDHIRACGYDGDLKDILIDPRA